MQKFIGCSLCNRSQAIMVDRCLDARMVRRLSNRREVRSNVEQVGDEARAPIVGEIRVSGI